MPHDHSHSHDHGHSHAPASFGRAFAIGIALNLGFVAARGGLRLPRQLDGAARRRRAQSVRRARAGRRLGGGGDGAGAPPRRASLTGSRRRSILAALANSLFLLVAVGAIGAEAIRRLFHPAPTQGGTVMIVAAVGIVVNGITACCSRAAASTTSTSAAPYLHMAADAAVSAAVVVRRARDPVDRPAVGRSGDEPRRRASSSCGAASACSRNRCGCRSPACPAGSTSTRSRPSWPSSTVSRPFTTSTSGR